jgi:hypothetical protein
MERGWKYLIVGLRRFNRLQIVGFHADEKCGIWRKLAAKWMNMALIRAISLVSMRVTGREEVFRRGSAPGI